MNGIFTAVRSTFKPSRKFDWHIVSFSKSNIDMDTVLSALFPAGEAMAVQGTASRRAFENRSITGCTNTERILFKPTKASSIARVSRISV
jgi:hypothetical protein